MGQERLIQIYKKEGGGVFNLRVICQIDRCFYFFKNPYILGTNLKGMHPIYLGWREYYSRSGVCIAPINLIFCMLKVVRLVKHVLLTYGVV